MEISKKISYLGIGILIAYSAFIVWYSVQVFKQAKIIAQVSSQAVQYINAGIAAGLLPSVEQISEKLKK